MAIHRAFTAGTAAASCAILASCAGTERAAPALEPDDAASAARFRYEQRLDERGEFPQHAVVRAAAQRSLMRSVGVEGGPGASIGDSIVWTWLGPGNIGGRVRSILVNPADPNTMWCGGVTGGVWKSTTAGASWFPLDGFVPALTVSCMALDPADPATIYAGTGEGFFDTVEGSSNTAAVRGDGVFKTTDGGATWAQLAATATPDFNFVNRVVLAPGNPATLLAATNTGIFRSTDSGATWTRVFTGQALQVLFHPTDPTKAWAGRNNGAALYSLDGGQTWAAATGIPATGLTRVELQYAPGAPATVYAAISDGATMRIWRSLDGGVSYTQRTTSGGATLESYTGCLWVDPQNSGTLLLGAQYMYRSVDGGATLSSAFGSVHSDNHIITPHPAYNGTTNRTLFFGTDGGVFRTTDPSGSSATSLNNNLGITQFYGASVNPNGIVLAGAQDNFTLRYSGNPQGWTQTQGGDGGFTAADPTAPNYMYGEYQRFGLFRSTDAGFSINAGITSGLTDAGTLNCNFIPFFMLDPNNPNTMLAGGRNLWRTTNVKTSATWGIIKPPIGPRSGPGGGIPTDHFLENSPFNISSIAVAQGDSNQVWVGYNKGEVWKTTNGTAATPAWTRVDLNGPLPARWPQKILVDPANSARVYVAFLGYASGNVWKTENGGATWQNISGSGSGALPAVPVSGLALHPQSAGRLYAGTDIGMFLSVDDGATWAAVDTTSGGGPGLAPEEQLFFKDPTTLVVVTHGRGIYTAAVPVPPCYANCDGSTALPRLNVADFSCFLTRYAAGDPYANCDASTTPPVLNVADFACFLQQYAAGCP